MLRHFRLRRWGADSRAGTVPALRTSCAKRRVDGSIAEDPGEAHSSNLRPRQRRREGARMTDYAIELNGVCKSYRFFELQNIALRLQRGTIMGLIGPNGAGKSTTIRIL